MSQVEPSSAVKAAVIVACGGAAVALLWWMRRKTREAEEPLCTPPPGCLARRPYSAREKREADALLAQQEDLRGKIRGIMMDFPESHCYDSEQARAPSRQAVVAGFQTFLRHIDEALETSPRSAHLAEAKAALLQQYEDDSELRRLYTLLQCPKEASLLDLEDAYLEAPRGRKWKAWNKLNACALQQSPFNEAKIATMKEGKRAKLSRRNSPAMTGEDMEAWVEEVQASFAARTLEASQKAAEMWPEVAQDPTYVAWAEMKQLWTSTGVERLCSDYKGVDSQEGTDRMFRGGLFEEEKARTCACMVIELLRQDARARGEDFDLQGVDYHTNVIWGELPRKGNKVRTCGEIDVVVLQNNEVVAIVEMKTCAFEIAAASAQHSRRVAAAMAGAMELAVDGASSASLAFGRAAPRIFVATLIPPHQFVLGIEPAVVRLVAEALYGKRRSKGGTYSWEADTVRIDDAEACEKTLKHIRNTMEEKDKPLLISPVHMLDERDPTVLIMNDEDEDISRYFAGV